MDHSAVEKLIQKNNAILERMAESEMPPTAAYYKCVESIAKYRIDVAQRHHDDPERVEAECRCGQVEELVEQAEDEMELLEVYLEGRIWEHVGDEVEIELDPEHESVRATERMGEERV